MRYFAGSATSISESGRPWPPTRRFDQNRWRILCCGTNKDADTADASCVVYRLVGAHTFDAGQELNCCCRQCWHPRNNVLFNLEYDDLAVELVGNQHPSLAHIIGNGDDSEIVYYSFPPYSGAAVILSRSL